MYIDMIGEERLFMERNTKAEDGTPLIPEACGGIVRGLSKPAKLAQWMNNVTCIACVYPPLSMQIAHTVCTMIYTGLSEFM